MRVAIFSDVHGNAMALEAVLADVERVGGADAFWFIGDAVAMGEDPVRCLDLIDALPGLLRVRGNTDRLVIADSEEGDEAFLDLAATDRALAKRQIMMSRGSSWTRGVLVKAGWYDWLGEMPVEERVTLPDGTRVLLVHASPGTDDGNGLRDTDSEEEFAAQLEGADADLVIVGHTHLPIERRAGEVRAWNLGSVSMPFRDDVRAMWTLLEANDEGYTLTRQFAAYDIPEWLNRLEAAHHPAAAFSRNVWGGKDGRK